LEPPPKLSNAQWAEGHSRALKSAYEAGNKNALWKMIVVCALSKSPIPGWAASILEGADGYVAWGELNSWDELFGKPRQKSRSVMIGWNRRLEVWERIMDLHHRGAPINDDLFDRVGKELGIGARETVRKLYKSAKEEFSRASRKS
jgi:hypothetical protein